MKKFVVISILVSFLATSFAQIKDMPWEQSNVVETTSPIIYTHIRQADAAWSKTLWRIIDLREKMNLHLYYPTQPQGQLMSMGQVIFNAILNDSLPVYDDMWLKIKKAKIEVVRTSKKPKFVLDEYGEMVETADSTEDVRTLAADKVIQYKLREVWYFDKQRSSLQTQIMAIAPIVDLTEFNTSLYEDIGNDDVVEKMKANDKQSELGWIDYDDLRPYLANHYAFNTKNTAEGTNFDDLITWQRRFNSYVYIEENVYDNREIRSYIKNPWDQILESEKIVNTIRVFENDLWEF